MTTLVINSILLGIGLAMDAFSVSLADGLNEPRMKRLKVFMIPLTFALFQATMPLIGWTCIHFLVERFKIFEEFIPWIAFILLSFLGIKMIFDSIKCKEEKCCIKALSPTVIIGQGIATSIDALSVGFTIAEHNLTEALISVGIIGILTFFICLTGVFIGKKAGAILSEKAGILGGSILIIIGIEILLKGIL